MQSEVEEPDKKGEDQDEPLNKDDLKEEEEKEVI